MTSPRRSPSSIPESRLSSTAPIPDRPGEARLIESRAILAGRRLQTWRAPSLAARARAGQLVHLLEPARVGLLRPVLPIAGLDRVGGTFDLLLEDSVQPALGELARARVGDGAVFAGPLGRGVEIDARSRHLLLVTDGGGLARVRALIDEALGSGRVVTLLLGAPSVADVAPASLFPEAVEYVVATTDGSLGHHGPVTDLVPAYEAWADQCVAAGSPALVETMTTLAGGRDERLGVARLGPKRRRPVTRPPTDVRRRAWLQVALRLDAGCALAVCLGCVTEGPRGPLRICREGPVFAASELAGGSER